MGTGSSTNMLFMLSTSRLINNLCSLAEFATFLHSSSSWEQRSNPSQRFKSSMVHLIACQVFSSIMVQCNTLRSGSGSLLSTGYVIMFVCLILSTSSPLQGWCITRRGWWFLCCGRYRLRRDVPMSVNAPRNLLQKSQRSIVIRKGYVLFPPDCPLMLGFSN